MTKASVLFVFAALMLSACFVLSKATDSNVKKVVETQPVFANNSSEIVCRVWDFEDGIDGWSKHSDCKIDLELNTENIESQTLAVKCAYDVSTEYDWKDAPIIASPSLGFTVDDATHIAVDVYTDASFDSHAINITPYIISPDHEGNFTTAGANFSLNDGTLVGGYRKHTVSILLQNTDKVTLSPNDIIEQIVIVASGVSTDYSGKLYFDNLRLVKYGIIPQEEFEIANVDIKNSWKLIKGSEIQITCTAVGKEAPYNYTVYALKDGKICYKSSVRQEIYSLPSAGEYTIIVYCQSSDDSKTLRKVQKTITVYNDSSEVPRQKVVALTFDDGPDFNTGEILDVLKEKDVNCSIFKRFMQSYID